MTTTKRAEKARRLDIAGARELRDLWSSRAGRRLVGSVGLIFAVTVAGVIALWPQGTHAVDRAAPATLAAKVIRVEDGACPGGSGPDAQQCRTIVVDPDGPAPPGSIMVGPAEGGLGVSRGDAVRVSEIPQFEDAPAGMTSDAYSLNGVDYTNPLGVAALFLAGLALVALRWRGLLALAGVGLSVTLLTAFLVPAILQGHPPLLVALVGALAVMFVTLVLTNGVGAQTMAGALGISATLVLTTLLGAAAVRFTGLDGSGSELSIVLAQARPGLSLEGVLLAGMVVGGLGVLADTAVTQASAVMALRRTAPHLGAGRLYREAVVVGRDHLSATIHTLVLAYAGATLPLLLVLHAGGSSTPDMLNNTDIAEPILATLVGCAGLIAAVPITTALAAVLVARIPAQSLPDEHSGHHH